MIRCPFCGSELTHFVSYGGGAAYAVVCLDCACRGPAARSRDEARALWDARDPHGRLQQIPPMIRREPVDIARLQEDQ